MIVASMPILSAQVRSISPLERPRQKLPPPTTTPIWVPRVWASRIPSQMARIATSSNPAPFSPARASPLTFNKMRLYWFVKYHTA